jgi:RNA polymerase sigma-70 factor (ECF subfamily)
VRNHFRQWFSAGEDSSGDDLGHAEADHAASPDKNPADMTQLKNTSKILRKALQNLPLRQQQAFLLRAWEELSVAETATVMNCSEGSIKTHYSRAVHSLRKTLGDLWP